MQRSIHATSGYATHVNVLFCPAMAKAISAAVLLRLVAAPATARSATPSADTTSARHGALRRSDTTKRYGMMTEVDSEVIITVNR